MVVVSFVYIACITSTAMMCGGVAPADTSRFSQRDFDGRIEPTVRFPAPVYHRNTTNSAEFSTRLRRAQVEGPAAADRQRYIVQLKPTLTPAAVLQTRAQFLANASALGVSDVYVELHDDVTLPSSGIPSHVVFATLSGAAVDWIAASFADVVAFLEPDGYCELPPILDAILPEPDMIYVEMPDDPTLGLDVSSGNASSDGSRGEDPAGRRLSTSFATLSWNLDRIDQRTRPLVLFVPWRRCAIPVEVEFLWDDCSRDASA
jgi:hypothetical protein